MTNILFFGMNAKHYETKEIPESHNLVIMYVLHYGVRQ